MTDTLTSYFTMDEDKLKDSDIEKLLSYCSSGLNTDKWEVELSSKQKSVCGYCFGCDTGLFYLFLIENKLDNVIEIIRG